MLFYDKKPGPSVGISHFSRFLVISSFFNKGDAAFPGDPPGRDADGDQCAGRPGAREDRETGYDAQNPEYAGLIRRFHARLGD